MRGIWLSMAVKPVLKKSNYFVGIRHWVCCVCAHIFIEWGYVEGKSTQPALNVSALQKNGCSKG